MEISNSPFGHTFLQKQETLEQARQALKKEFIGIDRIIDEVIDNVSSWYFFPDLQEKPVVVNLWGLTGVGKTSLVNRLAELIDFQDAYYRFDLGEKEGSFSFRDSLDDLCENKDISPVIIALDEFQHSRTLTGPFQQETESDKNRMIWELIDSGKIQHVTWNSSLWGFENFIDKLQHLVRAGVRAKNGLVVSHIELFREESRRTPFTEGPVLPFVPHDEYETILDIAGQQFGLFLQQDVQNLLYTLSENETLDFLKKVAKAGKRPAQKNYSKALIFVLGNLDEAYSMSNNFSADIEADEFNRLSLQITVPEIKQALQMRFRNEQIARLGNIHIIYPALTRASYQQIIENELDKYAGNLASTFKLKITFDRSIHELVYDEGVYPTQGVRPVFTSIHQVLKSKISFFYTELFLRKLEVDHLSFYTRDKKLFCSYRKDRQEVWCHSTGITTTLENVRQEKRDDMQAITAVHESGHAVLSMVLMNTIPEVVYSITTDAGNQGFIYSSFPWKYLARRELIPRVAMMLGGYVAEELIFGKENLTAGASGDIETATHLLSEMFRNHGMGKTVIKQSIPADDKHAYHKQAAVEQEIKEAMEEAMTLAETTLKGQHKLLISLSDYLCDNRMLRKEQIRKMAEKALAGDIHFIDQGDHLFYRKHLKKLAGQIPAEPATPALSTLLSLNRKNMDPHKK